MPNNNTPICGCGVVFDLPKRNGGSEVTGRNMTILIPKASKPEGKSSKNRDERRPNIGSTSSIGEQTTGAPKNSAKHRKRLNSARRTRSADRSESHYTYIDSGSSIISGGIREDTIEENIYCTIDETPLETSTPANNSINQVDLPNRPQTVYAIPSMTSPPPTYDAAIAKSWQSGLPPSYEEYLCHKYAMLARSHTPPPPWSDSVGNVQLQARRELLASQPDLREYLARQGVVQSNSDLLSYHYALPREQLHNQQALRKQNARLQRSRAMPPRSQSESRVQNQRVSTMYDDAAFCMETTAIASAFEHGIAFCSIM